MSVEKEGRKSSASAAESGGCLIRRGVATSATRNNARMPSPPDIERSKGSALRRIGAIWARVGATAVIAALPGCIQPIGAANQPVPTERIEIGPTRQSPEEIQAEVMIFADRYWAVVAQVMDDVRRQTALPQRRLGAQSLKIVAVESAIRIATHPNPVVALLDMTVMVTLMRQVWEDHWAPNVYHEPPGGPVATSFESLEREIWTIAGRILSDSELEALRALITAMRAAYPDQVYVVNLRASEFASERQQSLSQAPGGPSLLALFALDPLASLAPTTREIQSSRLLAERAFFYASRLPGLVSWRADRALLFAAAMPEVQEARETAAELRAMGDRLGAMVETIMPEVDRQRLQTIEQLSSRLRTERAEAVEDLFHRIALERQAVFDELRASEGPAGAILGDLDRAAGSATTLSESLQRTLAEGRLLMGALGEFRTGEEGGRPFDIREYESAVRAGAETTRELSTLIASLDQMLRAPEWAARRDDATATIGEVSTAARRLLDRAFALALALIAFAVGSTLLAAVAYRSFGARGRRAAAAP